MLCSIGYIWWPYAFKQFDLWLTTYYRGMTFKPSNVLHSGQGFLLPNLVAIRDFL